MHHKRASLQRITLVSLGASLATQIIDNPLRDTQLSSTLATGTPLSSSSHSDPKRTMYRALMLRGMACRPAELQPATTFEHDASPPISCDEARKILQDLILGSAIDPEYVSSAIDGPLQSLALAQVKCIAFMCPNRSNIFLVASISGSFFPG
jgi:hypothetical protein